MNKEPSPNLTPRDNYDGEEFVLQLLDSVFNAELRRATQSLHRDVLRDLATLCFDYEIGTEADRIEIFETILEILRDEPLTAERLVELDGEQ